MKFYIENDIYHIVEPKNLLNYNRLAMVCDFVSYNKYPVSEQELREFYNPVFVYLITSNIDVIKANDNYNLWFGLAKEFITQYIDYKKDLTKRQYSMQFSCFLNDLQEGNNNILLSELQFIDDFPRLVYNITHIYTMLWFDINVTYNELLQKKSPIVIGNCENCGRFFVIKTRSDTKYCDNPSPQNSTITCQKYKTSGFHTLKENKSNINKMYNNLYELLKRRTTRHPNIVPYQETFQKFKIESKEWKKAVKDGSKTEKEYENWLKTWVS